MNFDSTSLSALTHKKTSPQDKLKLLEQIASSNLSYVSQLQVLSYLLEATADRTPEVKDKAAHLATNYVSEFNPYLLNRLCQVLTTGLTNDKNTKVKVATLNLITLVLSKPTARYLVESLISSVSDTITDFSQDVSRHSLDIINKLYELVDNKDITPLVPHLIAAMSDSANIAKSIDRISSTTFVQNVDAETLAILVPILVSSFHRVPIAVKRQSIVIIENMTKLVENPYRALGFINKLLPLLDYGRNEIPTPEVREVATRAYEHLQKILVKGQEMKTYKDNQLSQLTNAVNNCSDYDREILTNMIETNSFTLDNLNKYLSGQDSTKLFEIYSNFGNLQDDTKEDTDAEELCNCEFTLGYGSKVLLHKTRLHLYRGFKYGLLGTNNSGKSTLMKAMATRQLESFPQHLRSVYVETDILGELSHLSLVDYILQDSRLKDEDLSKDKVEDYLKKFHFTEQMLQGGVSTLSGGWRMKLALSRAMMQNADILLMDEPSAHLDVMNVRWLLDYLKSLTSVTCIIVSQNAKLLDECCDHIIQIDSLKLHQYKGNLSVFAETHPEVSSYFDLQTDKYRFKFPQPRFLDGVKSKGKALMKMDGVTFTYPGNSAPTIRNAAVQVSLSSRIGCLGPNGAGKSTSIKILTGQLEPQSGTVWTYPGLKIGYIAQHAFAHIEQHLEKTPNEYIRWRYEGGEDKEDLKKITMTMSDDDLAKLKREVQIETESGSRIKKIIKRLTYGRRVGKREKEYEVELENTSMDQNIWLSESDLTERGYSKLLKVIDSKCDASEGGYSKALTQQNVEEHLESIGMTKENATHVKIKQLSNGEKVKVVIGAALWMCPHILILDEPTNNIDRDGLAALKVAINEFEGGIIIITHDEQFCNSICKEIWVIENCVLNVKGDPEWMQNALKTKVETKQEESMVDALGNVVKVKPQKKQLTRKEKMAREKYKQMLRDQGEHVSDSDDD